MRPVTFEVETLLGEHSQIGALTEEPVVDLTVARQASLIRRLRPRKGIEQARALESARVTPDRDPAR